MTDYILIKKDYEKRSDLEKKKLKGLRLKPKKVIYKGIKVDKLLIIKPNFIEKLLKKKIKRKLNIYLQYIIDLLEEEESDESLNEVLTDLKRYKAIVDNKYRIYLEEKYIELLIKKIELLEHELKAKMFLQSRVFEKEYEEVIKEPVYEETFYDEYLDYEEEFEMEHKRSR
ncbi:MAG: hypothetical protein R3Y21_04955 [Mycoplasmatota bacterium]